MLVTQNLPPLTAVTSGADLGELPKHSEVGAARIPTVEGPVEGRSSRDRLRQRRFEARSRQSAG